MSTAEPRWSVYILRCSDGTLYTGATNDCERRLAQHAEGDGARYTRSRLPVQLVYEERVADRGAALRREAAVKRLSRAEKQALVDGSRRTGAEETAVDGNGTPRRKLTVRPVYRAIVKKNERQEKRLYDVLVCGHAVPAATDNTFRKARPCPECRLRVQEYVDQQRSQPQPPAARATSRAR